MDTRLDTSIRTSWDSVHVKKTQTSLWYVIKCYFKKTFPENKSSAKHTIKLSTVEQFIGTSCLALKRHLFQPITWQQADITGSNVKINLNKMSSVIHPLYTLCWKSSSDGAQTSGQRGFILIYKKLSRYAKIQKHAKRNSMRSRK